MLYRLNTVNKQAVLAVGVKGVTLKKYLGNIVKNGITCNETKEIDRNTLIEIIAFNFNTNKVRLKCIKNLNSYEVEVGYKYLLDDCVLDNKDFVKPIDVVLAKYYIQNVVDKETAIFILVMVMTYIFGMLIGKII